MTKVVMAISNHGHLLGGGEYSFLDLISNLPSNFTGVAVVPFDGDLADKLRQRGIETHAIPLPPLRPWKSIDIFSALQSFFSLCRKRRPALIYANGSRAALYGGILGRLRKLPVVWHCRITDRDLCLDHLLAKLSTRIVANSKSTARRFNQNFQTKIRIVYNGIDLKWFGNNSVKKPELADNDRRIVLLVARASKMKRHDLAISAFEQVADSEPDLHLVCIGGRDHSEPGWWSYLQQRTRASKVARRIHWLGTENDVRPWYHAADILLFPCENESFGRVLVEAMACGLPVVAARSGAVPEIVRDGQDGFLVTPGEDKELAAAVGRILSDDSLRRSLGHAARKRARIFDMESHVKNMLSVFDEVGFR